MSRYRRREKDAMAPRGTFPLLLAIIALGFHTVQASEPRMTASGAVFDEVGKAESDAVVHSFCIRPGTSRKDAVINDSDPTGSDGRFLVRGLPAGTCHLRVEGPWAGCMSMDPTRGCWVEIQVQLGVNVRDIELKAPPSLTPAGSLSGRVVDAQGVGLLGYRAVAACVDPPSMRTAMAWSALTDSDGSFDFPRLPPGTWRLRPEACSGKTCTSISVEGRLAPCAAGEACVETVIEAHAERKGIVLLIAEAE
jgi:hypothetical protein